MAWGHFMGVLKGLAGIFLGVSLIARTVSPNNAVMQIASTDTRQTIPYSESCMAKFSKDFKETNEIYIESDDGKRKTVIDVQSGNAYEEVTENGETKRTYFLNQVDRNMPAGVYSLFEKNGVSCFYPIEGDSTIDIYKLLTSMDNADIVEVSYDGINRVETISGVWGGTMTMIFWNDTAIPISAGRKNDMEDFMIIFNMMTQQIPDAKMKNALQNGLKGYSLYIPPYVRA